MTMTPHQPVLSSSSQQGNGDHPLTFSIPATLPDLSTPSTLWVPLHEPRQQWADFGKEALTTSALMATSTAFGGLFWEARALQHHTWAADERERGRWHQAAFWLERATQDLDCALDQWQQVLSWLDLAGNDHRQQDPESLQAIRTLLAQVQWHQSRRRLLHQQVQQEYSSAKQQVHAAHLGNHDEEGMQR
jgi:hypothetical protein